MKKENTENKDQSKDNVTKSKKSSYSKKKKLRKTFLMVSLIFNQLLITQ